ncbi:serine hydrolase domain-containing protein [Aquimarina megaterium]|uniref:serine hydrolase domain-containing protein n=1 Tax=Aquimarina megaterium TaxID=1443666 RepID=UPI000471A942|nr:serine hydrolase domain-containing protein [Aquimarina megaterium]
MNQLKQISIAYILLFITMSGISFGQTNSEFIRVPDGRNINVFKLNQHLEKAMDSIGVPGLSIAIVNNNKIVYHNTFGVVNNKTQEPVTKQTIFEAASLSKPLFAYFIMKMAEMGKIDIDKPIYPYLKAIFPAGVIAKESFEAYKTLTPRIIMSHGTGIPNWVKGPIKIAFKPGTDFSYSGEAYQHLGAALGTKLDIGWGSALDSLFLKEAARPIGMDRSFYTWNDILENHAAKGHMKGKVNLEMHRDKKVGPGYSLQSDARDYALFLIEMMNPRNIKKQTRDEMLKEHNHFKSDNKLLKETGQTGWGLGFAQKPTPYGMMHLHTGNNQDFQAYTMFIPNQEYGFVMFGNSDNLFPLLETIEQLLGEHF